jgi:hypothetical protein
MANIKKENCVSCGTHLIEKINWRKTSITRKCSKCLSDSRKEYYKENKERIIELKKERELENPQKLMFIRVKTRAKRRGIPFNLELSDIVIPDKCPIFNIPFVFGKKSPHNASLDRIDPSKGYVKGNVIVISYRANSIKNDATPDELRQVADYVDKLLISGYE